MKPAILALGAAAIAGSAPPGPVPPYRADGFEPNWSLVIGDGRLTYDPGTSERRLGMPLPRRQAIPNGYRLVAPRLIVEVRHVRCESYAGRSFADSVDVTFDGQHHDGCGGNALPPRALADSFWEVQAVGGTTIDRNGGIYQIGFRDGRMTGRVGCNEISATYRERRPVLTLGTVTVTRAACPPARLAMERRALAILRAGPLRMTFVDGDTLVLGNRAGQIRLLP